MISNLRSTALYYRFLYTTEVRTDHAVQRTDHGLRNAHRPWAAQCAQTRSDKANDKDADSLDLINECEPPESRWVVRRNCPE